MKGKNTMVIQPTWRSSIRLLSFIRFKDWWYLSFLFWLGVGYAVHPVVPWGVMVKGYVVIIFYLAGGYLMNEYCDHIREDRDLLTKENWHNAASLSKIIVSVFFLAAFGLSIFISFWAMVCTLWGIVLSWAYSSYPLRLKRYPIPAVLINSAGFSNIFIIGLLGGEGITSSGLAALIYVAVLFIAIELMHDLDHAIEDSSHGIVSVVHRYGAVRVFNMILCAIVSLQLLASSMVWQGVFSVCFFYLSGILCLALTSINGWFLYSRRRAGSYQGIKRAARMVLALFGAGWILLLYISRFISGSSRIIV